MKIDPCPFCGSVDVECVEHGFGYAQRDYVWVLCKTCDAEGPPEKDQDSAIEKWNTRAVDQK